MINTTKVEPARQRTILDRTAGPHWPVRRSQVNGPARRFYQRHGFTEAERTDGQRNDEREPDLRRVWQPQT